MTFSQPHASANFAHNLLVARVARGWTQQTLATAAGISRATIAQLEAGNGDPKLSTVEQLANALGVQALLLLLGSLELGVLATMGAHNGSPTLRQHPALPVMRHLVSTGFIRSRLQAATLGVECATEIGIVTNNGARIGAALGSYHLPGNGTVAGGIFGKSLDESGGSN